MKTHGGKKPARLAQPTSWPMCHVHIDKEARRPGSTPTSTDWFGRLRAGIRRLHGMAVRRRSIQVRVTTANARVQGTLDFKSSR